jgi:glucan 1,6-alpha-glucosidase
VKQTSDIYKWWKNAVIYQIYPKSFQDSNGDGIGDIPGIITRLDYLKKLGIDAIWLSPVYRSPQYDNGYDISDYKDIDPMFGTMNDMENLIKEAKKRNIRIIMDLVLNHTSDEHYWFQEAKKSRSNPYHDYYVWRNGVEGTPPNDMKSTFGGSAWTWVPEVQQYYFHQFSEKQPDLNWDDPKVRREIYDMILWWMNKGVEGFRLDVIDQIAKEPDHKITVNGPKLHEYIRELSKETFQKGKDIITVGEAWGADPERAKMYSNPDNSEFSMVFQFEHICLDQQEGKSKWDLAPLDLVKLKNVLAKWQKELYQTGWNSLFWNNHDLPRIVSRWGNDGKYRVESAKMLATILYGLQGTPYIYQGEELGMTNVRYNIEDYRDIETLNLYKERTENGYSVQEVMNSIYAKGRDNARTPMQWDDSENAGFTIGIPWIKVNPNYKYINARNEMKDEKSVFNYYRKLIQLRKSNDIFIKGRFELLFEKHPELFIYTRTWNEHTLLVVANFYGVEEYNFTCHRNGDGRRVCHQSMLIPEIALLVTMRSMKRDIYNRMRRPCI